MSKSLIEITAQELSPRIKALEERDQAHSIEMARLNPDEVRRQLTSLKDGQVKLMIKMATLGGGAGLAGGGLVYWLLQMLQVGAAP